jgi:hypothetical protein
MTTTEYEVSVFKGPGRSTHGTVFEVVFIIRNWIIYATTRCSLAQVHCVNGIIILKSWSSLFHYYLFRIQAQEALLFFWRANYYHLFPSRTQ